MLGKIISAVVLAGTAAAAGYIAKKKYPDLKVKMFGAYARPTNLPEWIEYTQNASKEETIDIYNSIKESPNYPSNFETVKNGTKKYC